jgi:aspartate racemase
MRTEPFIMLSPEKGSQGSVKSVKTIGIIGGIGPESTIEYYRSIVACYGERMPDGSDPSIIINSIDLKKVLDLVSANERAELTQYLVNEIQRLARAGAECGLVAGNTPHIAFDEVPRRSPIPLISIVEATCEAAKTLGLKKLGLLGALLHDARTVLPGRFFQRRDRACPPRRACPKRTSITYV